MSPLHTVRLCRTGSIKWTWKYGQMAHQITSQPFVDRLTQPLNMCLRKNNWTKSDTISDCGQQSKVIQQLKPLRETAIATMAGNTRSRRDQENFNCQFARYAFNLTSFPSGCVWKWGTPMYSQNGNLKDLKGTMRIKCSRFTDNHLIFRQTISYGKETSASLRIQSLS